VSVRILITSDDDQIAQRLRGFLTHQALECPAGHVVGLDVAVDRASRLTPDLLLLVLPPKPSVAIKSLREVRQTLHKVHILAVGPATDAKLVLKTLHNGADEYLDAAQLETELTGALVRWKARRNSTPQRQQPGRVLSVLAPSGGSGSSTIAVNLSAMLVTRAASAGLNAECGLVDLNLAAGDLAAMLNLKPEHTLSDLSNRLERLDQSMFEQLFAKHRSGVHLLAAPHEFVDAKKVTGKVVRRVMAMARARFPYTVLDLANAYDSEQVEALWQSDEILLVLRLDYTSVRNTHRTIDNLCELGIELDRVRLVANGYRLAKQLRFRDAERALGMKIQYCLPSDPARVNHAINRGVPVVLHRPNAKISRSIMDLAVNLNGLHQE
jgi:pilus assembly protein CpaE